MESEAQLYRVAIEQYASQTQINKGEKPSITFPNWYIAASDYGRLEEWIQETQEQEGFTFEGTFGKQGCFRSIRTDGAVRIHRVKFIAPINQILD